VGLVDTDKETLEKASGPDTTLAAETEESFEPEGSLEPEALLQADKYGPVVFGSALALRLFYNFGGGHPNAFAAADASEYIRYTTALSTLLSGSQANFAQILKEFVITGPSLPVFLLIANSASGKPFDGADSTIPLIAQSLVSAGTVALIYAMAKNLYDRKTALAAGIIAAIYPAFIVNSGRLYSETFATFIECLSLFFLVRGLKSLSTLQLAANNVALGMSLIVLQLSRSAMILLTAMALPVVFLQGLLQIKRPDWRRAILSLAFLLAGAAAMLAPWLTFEKAAYNKITLVVDRVGHYNLFVGTDTKTQGFLSYPYPDGHGIEEHSFLSLVARSFKQSPSRFIRLAMDKPARLFKMPWNDFRASIGPFDYKWQVALHQAIILLAVAGILLAGTLENDGGKKEKLARYFGRAIILLAFVLNLPYLAFITVPRYNLTAMPTLIIFAAAGLTAIVQLLRHNALAKAPKALAFAMIALYIFLRDDLKDPFNLGQAAVFNIDAVAGTEPISRGLIGGAFALALFAAIYICIGLLEGHKRAARVLTAIAALTLIPLATLPQRANGRPQENIVTFARAKEELLGKISLPTAALQDNQTCYLLVDCADPTIFSQDLTLTVNGKKLTGPFIPGIAALDDWHYLKAMGNGAQYLECEYIFDCMTQPTAISNLDLRQWFYIPLDQALVDDAKRRQALDITIKHNSDAPSTLFAASTTGGESLLPCRDLYSWEKCFYGVENDAGLTDTRFDEKVPKRTSRWRLNYDKNSEELTGIDLNVRLWCQPSSRQDTLSSIDRATNISASGKEKVQIALDQVASAEAQAGPAAITLIQVKLGPGRSKAPPTLTLSWVDKAGKPANMRMPWLKNTAGALDIAVPCDLSQIKEQGGHDLVVKAVADNGGPITLKATIIDQHPIFGQGQLF
jgi:4-amino-4-deoxy-L-arabinose transferase-like glycosyltransferase